MGVVKKEQNRRLLFGINGTMSRSTERLYDDAIVQRHREHIEFFNLKQSHRNLKFAASNQFEREYWTKHQNS